jgi:hypothetical protein
VHGPSIGPSQNICQCLTSNKKRTVASRASFSTVSSASLDVSTPTPSSEMRSLRPSKGQKSRELIAEEMSHLIGTEITVAMLNAYTATSKRLHRFPAAWIPAFCTATGDSRLLQYLSQRTGFRMITERRTEVPRTRPQARRATDRNERNSRQAPKQSSRKGHTR